MKTPHVLEKRPFHQKIKTKMVYSDEKKSRVFSAKRMREGHRSRRPRPTVETGFEKPTAPFPTSRPSGTLSPAIGFRPKAAAEAHGHPQLVHGGERRESSGCTRQAGAGGWGGGNGPGFPKYGGIWRPGGQGKGASYGGVGAGGVQGTAGGRGEHEVGDSLGICCDLFSLVLFLFCSHTLDSQLLGIPCFSVAHPINLPPRHLHLDVLTAHGVKHLFRVAESSPSCVRMRGTPDSCRV